ncbi:hypothetical protein [Agrococcus beijingensis]|uniref:hypothetical protein n=1 Tax=Agrococcus beijingensis TaxID=3068634 RepID=UPI002742030B|nr:hypothetical protein [Agrococcus sp. REN33]
MRRVAFVEQRAGFGPGTRAKAAGPPVSADTRMGAVELLADPWGTVVELRVGAPVQ